MHDVWAIHMVVKFKSGKKNIGYLGNETTIYKPKLNIRYVSYQKTQTDFETIIFFLTARLAQHTLDRLLIEVHKEYKNPDIIFSLKKFNIGQKHLNSILANKWRFENV